MEEEIQQLEELKNTVVMYLVQNGVRILVAIIIVVVGIWLGKLLAGFIQNMCDKRKLDQTLSRFLAGLVKAVVIGFALVIALDKVGLEITPFVALLGASAFGLSLAVQGPISNYGAGVVLIVTRPFRVGDTLQVSGCWGVVEYIQLGFTQLVNEDDEQITIPNRKILGEILTNSQEYSKFEGKVGIEYAADPEKAIAVIREAINKVEGIPPERPCDVGIAAFGDSSITIGYRVMVPTRMLHRTQFATNLAVFKALREAGITIPFPQRDVHLVKQPSGAGE